MWRSWADVKEWYRPSIGEMRLSPSISQKQSPACLSPSERLISHSFGITNRWDYIWQCAVAMCIEHHTCNDMHQSLHHADLSVVMCISLHQSLFRCTDLSKSSPSCQHLYPCVVTESASCFMSRNSHCSVKTSRSGPRSESIRACEHALILGLLVAKIGPFTGSLLSIVFT